MLESSAYGGSEKSGRSAKLLSSSGGRIHLLTLSTSASGNSSSLLVISKSSADVARHQREGDGKAYYGFADARVRGSKVLKATRTNTDRTSDLLNRWFTTLRA
jgi:hypothetical protein